MAEDRVGPIVETAINKLVTAASVSGYFERVQSVEPKSGPSTGLTFAMWLTAINPIAPRSGLSVTSARLLITYRIYSPMLVEPQDRIDIDLGKASSYLLAQLTGDFTIDGAWIDLLGAHGVSLATEFAYVELDRSMYRIADTTVPFICDDVFDQEA
jgi:hypothetical protein